MSKKFKITVIHECTEEFYEKEVLSLKNEILSGEFQREMLSENSIKKGLLSIKATFEEIK